MRPTARSSAEEASMVRSIARRDRNSWRNAKLWPAAPPGKRKLPRPMGCFRPSTLFTRSARSLAGSRSERPDSWRPATTKVLLLLLNSAAKALRFRRYRLAHMDTRLSRLAASLSTQSDSFSPHIPAQLIWLRSSHSLLATTTFMKGFTAKVQSVLKGKHASADQRGVGIARIGYRESVGSRGRSDNTPRASQRFGHQPDPLGTRQASDLALYFRRSNSSGGRKRSRAVDCGQEGTHPRQSSARHANVGRRCGEDGN